MTTTQVILYKRFDPELLSNSEMTVYCNNLQKDRSIIKYNNSLAYLQSPLMHFTKDCKIFSKDGLYCKYLKIELNLKEPECILFHDLIRNIEKKFSTFCDKYESIIEYSEGKYFINFNITMNFDTHLYLNSNGSRELVDINELEKYINSGEFRMIVNFSNLWKFNKISCRDEYLANFWEYPACYLFCPIKAIEIKIPT